VCSLGTVR